MVGDVEFRALVERRVECDLFVTFTTPGPEGHLAGYRDRDGMFRDTFLTPTSASILAELVEGSGKAIRANALRCIKESGLGSAVRLVQQARKMVDVNAVVGGKVSRTTWRAFHTVGDKNAMAFKFEPPAGFHWVVLVRSD